MADGYGIGDLENKIDEMQSRGVQFSIDNLKDFLQKEFMKEVEKIYDRNVKNQEHPEAKEMKAVMQDFKDFIRSSGMATTKMTEYLKIMSKENVGRTEQGTMNKERFLWSANANVSNAGQRSVRALDSGSGDVFLDPNKKSARGNALGQTITKAYMQQLLNKIDSAIDKLLAFLSGKYDEKENKDKKKFNTLAEDIVEGLAKSKFVGGAFMDLVKMFALFTGGFLKQFGPIGKAFAVAVVALAPVLGTILVNLFSKMLTSVLTNVFTSIFQGKLIGALGNLLKGAGGLLGKGVMGLGRAIFSPQGLAFAAAGGSFMAAASNWKEGGLQNRSAAVAQGVGGIAFALAPFLGPGAPIAVAVGVIANGIGLIIKHWQTLMDFVKGIGEKFQRFVDWISDMVDNVNDFLDDHPIVDKSLGAVASVLPGGKFLYDSVRSKTPSERNVSVGDAATSYGKLKVDKGGAAINLGELSQKTAQRYMEEYAKADPERFNQLYEVVPQGFASMVDFQNDVKMRGVNGKEGALLYKGATKDLELLRKNLVAAGMDEKTAAKLMYTSGIASKSSGHAKGGQHDNPLGYTFDLVGKGWSQKDYELADSVIKSFYSDWDTAEYEATVNGKGAFTKPGTSMKNAHYHIGFAKNKLDQGWTEGYKKNFENYDQWAEAKKASLKIKEPEKKEEQPKPEKEQDKSKDEVPYNKFKEAHPLVTKNWGEYSEAMNQPLPLFKFDPRGNNETSNTLRSTWQLSLVQPRQQ